MKVVCISTNLENYFKPNTLENAKVLGLTLHKSYEVLWLDNRWYEVLNDDGFKTFYDKRMFINLADWRDRQIDSIFED